MEQKELKNRSIFCSDNLEVLENINSNTIDLIYLDPPFNKKKIFTAPIGSQAEGAEFRDIFRAEDVKDEWLQTIKEDNEKLYNFLNGIKNIDGVNSYNYCYLCYMAIRLIECHRILKDTGSLYLHCDPTISHYLKLVLGCIFDEKNFRNEIVWYYTNSGGRSKKYYSKKHDIIFWYSKSENYFFDGKQDGEKRQAGITSKGGKIYYENGKKYQQIWSNGKSYTYCLDDDRIADDVWKIQPIPPHSAERTGYPTQKPLALLERIIKNSSNEGDMVLDPFCGCATTCIAAEKLGRQWIGIDVSKKAFELVKERLPKEIPSELWSDKTIYFQKTKKLKRTDGGGKYAIKKYVYIVSNPSEAPYLKVGIAKNLKSRLSSYQTSDKDRAYKLEYSYHTENFREIEKYIHQSFNSLKEWVNAEKEMIIFAIENYKKGMKPSKITGFGASAMPKKIGKLAGKKLTKAQKDAIKKDLGSTAQINDHKK